MSDLDGIALEHDQSSGFTPRLIACRARALNEMIPPGRVLDLGCADGILTRSLAEHHRFVVAVDASAIRCDRTRDATRGLAVEVRQAQFEAFRPRPDDRFDAVVLSCILEHVDDPVSLLRRCLDWLAAGGMVAAIVPNGCSIHRRVGVHMGLLSSLDSLAPSDDALDHKRVYTRERLLQEFVEAGMNVLSSGGLLFKPLPNSEMARLRPELVDAFERLGREFGDLAAEVFVVGAR